MATKKNKIKIPNLYKDVYKFNKQVIGMQIPKFGSFLSEKQSNWFQGVIKEEMSEFKEAEKNKNVVGQLDAILDAVYFLIGRAVELGFTEEQLYFHWNNIQKANMSKKKGNKGRGSNLDAIKPKGWKGPEEKFIKKYIK